MIKTHITARNDQNIHFGPLLDRFRTKILSFRPQGIPNGKRVSFGNRWPTVHKTRGHFRRSTGFMSACMTCTMRLGWWTHQSPSARFETLSSYSYRLSVYVILRTKQLHSVIRRVSLHNHRLGVFVKVYIGASYGYRLGVFIQL